MILFVAGTILMVNGLASIGYMLQSSSGSRIVWEHHVAKRFCGALTQGQLVVVYN